MESLKALFSNYVLVVAVTGWITAQVLKTLLTLITTREFKAERLTGAGGMPSAHSAAVCGLTVAMARSQGVDDPLFALSFLFAAVVMYDAMGVRRAAGEQAKTINDIVKHHEHTDVNTKEALKESLGHTPLEVLAGALLGILIAMLIPV